MLTSNVTSGNQHKETEPNNIISISYRLYLV